MKHIKIALLYLRLIKMGPKCEDVAQYLLPIFRSLVAKKLIEEYGFTQVEVAENLGTTQAAISQYITSKRGRRGVGKFKESLPKIQVLASKIAKKIVVKKVKNDEAMSSFCKICRSLQKKGKIPC